MEHTPWRWHETMDAEILIEGGQENDPTLICSMFHWQSEEAAFIVRAVNNHAKLLDALEQAVLFIEGVFPQPSPLLKQDLAYYRGTIKEANK